MSTLELAQAEETIAGWLRGDSGDSPAGPLFTGHAEADITMTGGEFTAWCGTICTYSMQHVCC
ncbi:DUF6229 family protein [Saccharothrix lopnurensis]|uniref:DUF6229 family protein n=1 Tax=Saccharothrix lopnurensis TaxID=1670621 RepID=A0ABW1PCW7_9PSEU